jgi:signal transduction histidine kinase/pSer/pThr/pTyr-binding forkhead associated (FHA) protein
MTAAPTASLRAITGDLQGQVFSVDVEIVIGRSTTCGIFVPDRRISREHARVYFDGERLFVEDLESHNGVYVNGQRVAKAELFNGDLLRMGMSQFSVSGLNRSDSGLVQVVHDTRPLQPRVVRPVESVPTDLGGFVADDYFAAMGMVDTDRYLTADRVQQLLQRTRNFAILHEISKALQRYTDLRETMPPLLDLLLQVVRGDRAAIVLLDEDGNLAPKTVRYRDRTTPPGDTGTLRISKTVADYVLTQRCAIITADASADERFSSSDSVLLANIRSLMVVPILVSNRLLGLIEVENNKNINGFDDNDLHLLTVVASMLGVGLDHLDATQARERAMAQLQATHEQLLATQERLVVSERMGLLGRLASGIAHEVKNHLSPFMLADMIASKYPQDQEIQEAAELMLEAQQRILGLVDEIRSFAAGGARQVNIAPHDLVDVIDGVLRFVRCDRAVKLADIQFAFQDRPLVFMDAQRIRQVLINLIRNAADALPPNGGRIDIRVWTEGDNVAVEVADNGRGIASELADKVFEPFFSTKGEKGLGLGLDISRQIVQAHSGALTFESVTGVGTTFKMAIPLVPPGKDPRPVDDMRTDPNGATIAALSTPVSSNA